MHLVSFSAVTWNFPLIGRTRMLSEAWQRLGIDTTFVQAPFLRSALERLLPPRRATPPPPVRVLRPWPTYPRRLWPLLSPPHLRAAIRERARGLRRELEAVLDWEAAAAIVVSPVWTPWLDELPFRVLVYDCIDDLQVHVPRPKLGPLYQAWEAELIDRADGAIVTAGALGERLCARRVELPVAVIRNGVDAGRFAALAARQPAPALRRGGRPIVGFVGVMSGGATYEWLDWDLLLATVRALPEFDFVFVGPYERSQHAAALERLEHVRLLGWQPYERVPGLVAAFDACWVPFNPGAVGRLANPVKIYEYLALGKPVVTTPVSDVGAFDGLVTVAADAAQMIAALRSALSAGIGSPRAAISDEESVAPDQQAAARVAFARANSWQARARACLEFVEALKRQ